MIYREYSLPAYQDYTVRAKMSEVMLAASACPIAVNGWRCGLPADGTTILSKYLPGSCRGS
jgi:hypothetical protein